MFNAYEKLSLLPDISKWNTGNLINMDSMFNECKKLTSFPTFYKELY